MLVDLKDSSKVVEMIETGWVVGCRDGLEVGSTVGCRVCTEVGCLSRVILLAVSMAVGWKKKKVVLMAATKVT